MKSNSPTAARGAGAEFDALERNVVDHVFAVQPSYAVFLGLHEYDGRVPDLTRAATERWTDAAEGLLARIRALPDSELSPERRLDAMMLALLLESGVYDFRESRDYDRNPMVYVGSVSLTAYMVRDYAPIESRVDAMVRVLEGVPRVLEEGRARLDQVLPEPFVRLAGSIGTGLPAHFVEAEELARRSSAALGEKILHARQPAEAAVADFLRRLKDEYAPRATSEFALGPERYQRLLWVREGIRTPFAEIEKSGRRALRRNQERLAEIAAGAKPPRGVDALLEECYRDHSSSASLISDARSYVDETKDFVAAHRLATLPPQASCRVEETPVYGRALSTASMNPPGPYDTGGDEGIYFVTPVDPAWTPERQEEWLRSLGRPILKNITAHEVYPGHYLQFLHFRAAANSTTRRVFLSNSYTEGWAHYCEQLMIEEGFGSADPRAEAAQLHDALLRDCRLLSSIGLHTGGMTLAQSAELFRKEAHMEALPAEREAIRGSFNPEYFCYTLGKLAILEARSKFLGSRFGGSLHKFHDRLLAFGAPPVGLFDRLFEAS